MFSVKTPLGAKMNKSVHKLVRDKIPKIIRDNGGVPIARVVSKNEYIEKLREKLQEEVCEFLESGKAEELADIIEVILAICDARGLSRAELEKIRIRKLKMRGGFKRRIILEDVRGKK